MHFRAESERRRQEREARRVREQEEQEEIALKLLLAQVCCPELP